MKLLLIGPLPPPFGGATVLFKLLVDQLAAQGEEGVAVVNTAGSSRLSMMFEMLKGIMRSDVVSFHASSKNLILVGGMLSLFCRLFGKRCVLRAFGGNLLEMTNSLGALGRICLRSVLKADAVLVEMQELKRHVLNRNPQAKVHWFPNSRAFDLKSITALPSNSGKPLRFGYFAHVRREKGIVELIDATKQLGDGMDCEVHVYGKLFDNVDASGFDECDNVHFHGEIDTSEVKLRMQECDVIVLPTWYEGEGYPGTLIEAFGLGRPVIATNWRFIPELVEDGVSGILVPTKDPQSLMKAMKRLDSDRDLLSELSLNAVKVAESLASAHWNGEVFVELCRGVDQRC